MAQEKFKKSALIALFIAGKYAFIVFVCLLISFFVAAACVMGDGTAPKYSHITFAIIEYTARYLGFSDNGSFLTVAIFWASIVFILVFVFILLKRIVSLSDDKYSESRTKQYGAFIFVGIFCMVCYFLYTDRQNNMVMKKEKQLVINFVKHNEEVIQKVGDITDVFISYRRDHALPGSYLVNAHGLNNRGEGSKVVYAIINVSRKEGVARFTLACFTSDAFHDKCE
jgi:hypothetical protein